MVVADIDFLCGRWVFWCCWYRLVVADMVCSRYGRTPRDLAMTTTFILALWNPIATSPNSYIIFKTIYSNFERKILTQIDILSHHYYEFSLLWLFYLWYDMNCLVNFALLLSCSVVWGWCFCYSGSWSNQKSQNIALHLRISTKIWNRLRSVENTQRRSDRDQSRSVRTLRYDSYGTEVS